MGENSLKLTWEKLNHSFPANQSHVFPKLHAVTRGLFSLSTGSSCQPGLMTFRPGQVWRDL